MFVNDKLVYLTALTSGIQAVILGKSKKKMVARMLFNSISKQVLRACMGA
jgi:hypothetical protein